jgi:hypothetical protein
VIALAFYMAKIGNPSAARLIASYYPVVVAALLVLLSLDGRYARRPVVAWVGILAMLSAFPLVILSPARPLFPVAWVSEFIAAHQLSSPIAKRFDQVYTTYSHRADPYRELIALIPPEEHTVGLFVAGDEPDAPAWRPFGTRKIIDVMPTEARKELKARNINYVLVSFAALYTNQTTIDAALARWGGTLVSQQMVTLKVHLGPEPFYLLRL